MENIFRNYTKITPKLRNVLNKHKSFVVWFTGISSSGKTTIANLVDEKLFNMGVRSFVLDGDNIRCSLCSDLNFTDKDRTENNRRIGEVARLMVESGTVVLVSVIAPFEKDRKSVKKLFNKDQFLQIYCNASIAICKNRDLKGLYSKASKGKIENFTAIDSQYECPHNSNIIIDTGKISVEDSVEQAMNLIKKYL